MAKQDRPTPEKPEVSLADILNEMHAEGNFQLSVLATQDGLPVTTAPKKHNSELAAALVALIQKVSVQAKDQLYMGMIDEMTIRDENKNRLVCRQVALKNETLILAAIVPPDHCYRRVTNRAIRRILRFFG
jgi:predicted regulator of Ras-like GTPase activity (Roadblock/LC7/MglB family)